jgi:hypothetical protein
MTHDENLNGDKPAPADGHLVDDLRPEWLPKIEAWLAAHPAVKVGDADGLADDWGTINAAFIFDDAQDDWGEEDAWTLGCESLAELFSRLFSNVERALAATPDYVLTNQRDWIDANRDGDAIAMRSMTERFTAYFEDLFDVDTVRAEAALVKILEHAREYYGSYSIEALREEAVFFAANVLGDAYPDEGDDLVDELGCIANAALACATDKLSAKNRAHLESVIAATPIGGAAAHISTTVVEG